MSLSYWPNLNRPNTTPNLHVYTRFCYKILSRLQFQIWWLVYRYRKELVLKCMSVSFVPMWWRLPLDDLRNCVIAELILLYKPLNMIPIRLRKMIGVICFPNAKLMPVSSTGQTQCHFFCLLLKAQGTACLGQPIESLPHCQVPLHTHQLFVLISRLCSPLKFSNPSSKDTMPNSEMSICNPPLYKLQALPL